MEVNNTKNGLQKPISKPVISKNEYRLTTYQTSMNFLAHILIGCVVGANIIYSLCAGLPFMTTPAHIVLCVIGYQLLMAESILSLCPHNSWSAHLRLVDQKRIHWILQILGSGLAIVGSINICLQKDINWNSLHGQFGLVALVLTVASLLNGVTSLYAYEIRKRVPLSGKLSKVTHIVFGAVAFAAATISLCYGFEYTRFFFGDGVTEVLIGLSVAFTVIILINPCITFVARMVR